MHYPRALLEDWLREFYFTTELDLGCSGVENYSFGELRDLIGISTAEMDRVRLRDSHTLGSPQLRSAIARRFANGDPDCVMATHGSSEALCLVLTALLRSGDEVVVLDPCYPPLRSIAQGLGCRILEWRLDPARQFQPELERASRLID